MSFKNFAKRELELVGLFDRDSNYNGMIGTAVMELLDVFLKQNHSGLSAKLVAKLFYDLVLYKPLSPLKGDDDEWTEHGQNKRCPAVFKKDDGHVYYLDAIVW